MTFYDNIPARGGMREAGMGQGLTVGAQGVALGTAEALNGLLLCNSLALLGK